MSVEKICQLCDKIYFVKRCERNRTKYCSRKCSGTVNARRNGKIREEKYSSKEYLLSQIKIDKKTGCWIWQGSKNEDGYGRKRYKGRTTYVHRVFYEVFVGKIPKGMCVLHRCDTPACCNPSHLFIGTQKDNIDDMVNKNRHKPLIGEKHGSSKLTEKDVLEIRRLRKEGMTRKKISEKFLISRGYVYEIVVRRSWNHI